MIYQKGEFWAIRGYSQKYSTFEGAEIAYNRILEKQEKERLRKEEEIIKALENLDPDSTPFEVMIQKNICKFCNLEPCECSRCTSKMGLGEYLE